MQKVALVCLNSKFSHTSLGIWYIREYCRSLPCEFFIFDTFANRDATDIAADILACKPDIIGFSTYIFNVAQTAEVIKLVKNSGAKIVIGGPEATFNKSIWPLVDQIILGEGEIAWEKLLCGDNSQVIVGDEVKNIKYPYTDEFFKNAENRIVYFEASRGCPYRCSYCMSAGAQFRQFPFYEVTVELLKFKGRAVKLIKFVDRTANADKRYFEKLLSWIEENFSEENIRFHFEVSPELFDDALFAVIKRAKEGLFQFEIGYQSYNIKSLEAVNRRANLDTISKNIKTLTSFGNCHFHTDLIVGLPYEDYDSFINSFNQLYSLGGNQLQVGFLKVLKGSVLESNLPSGYKVHETAPYEVISTPWLSEDEVRDLKGVEVAVDKVFNSNHFKSIINFALKKSTPFALFHGLSAKIRDFSPLYEVYDGVRDYMLERGFERDIVEALLRFDYLRSCKDKVLPSACGYTFDKWFKSRTASLRAEYPYYRFYAFSINPVTLEKGDFILGFSSETDNLSEHLFSYEIFNA